MSFLYVKHWEHGIVQRCPVDKPNEDGNIIPHLLREESRDLFGSASYNSKGEVVTRTRSAIKQHGLEIEPRLCLELKQRPMRRISGYPYPAFVMPITCRDPTQTPDSFDSYDRKSETSSVLRNTPLSVGAKGVRFAILDSRLRL
jgi:hypothetical protein